MGNTQVVHDRHVRHPLAAGLGLILAVPLALYLVGRGAAEFFTVNYGDPASYAHDWGGPSLAGVFAVHTGPAVLIVAASAIYLMRRRSRSRRS